ADKKKRMLWVFAGLMLLLLVGGALAGLDAEQESVPLSVGSSTATPDAPPTVQPEATMSAAEPSAPAPREPLSEPGETRSIQDLPKAGPSPKPRPQVKRPAAPTAKPKP